MTTERIEELRALCAEYDRNKSIDEALGHEDQAADIAADGVGRKALEALPELLDELEKERRSHRNTMNNSWQYAKMWARAELANEDLIECVSTLNDLVDCLSTWLANAYIDPGFLPEIETCGMNPPQPEDVIAYAKSCINEKL